MSIGIIIAVLMWLRIEYSTFLMIYMYIWNIIRERFGKRSCNHLRGEGAFIRLKFKN